MGGGSGDSYNKRVSVHWFRQDLRLHDNPAFIEALEDCDKLYPIFIYDGKTASKYFFQSVYIWCKYA